MVVVGRLFKEYAIADLSRYKEGAVGLRWRTETEVVSGKGQFSCGAKRCANHNDLESYEVDFKYREAGEKKQALVKLRVCPDCAGRLNHRHARRKAKRQAKEEKREAKRRRRSEDASGGGGGGDGDAAGTLGAAGRSSPDLLGGGVGAESVGAQADAGAGDGARKAGSWEERGNRGLRASLVRDSRARYIRTIEALLVRASRASSALVTCEL